MSAGTELVELCADPMAGGASDGHVGGVPELLAEQHGIGQGVNELPQEPITLLGEGDSKAAQHVVVSVLGQAGEAGDAAVGAE